MRDHVEYAAEYRIMRPLSVDMPLLTRDTSLAVGRRMMCVSAKSHAYQQFIIQPQCRSQVCADLNLTMQKLPLRN